VSRPALLDSSYLIDLERETAAGKVGPARKFLSSLRGRPLVISMVSVEELLEGAIDEAAALAALQRFTIQGLHLTGETVRSAPASHVATPWRERRVARRHRRIT